jgi:hypothetical protein
VWVKLLNLLETVWDKNCIVNAAESYIHVFCDIPTDEINFLFIIMFQDLFASTKNEPVFLGRLLLRS